MSDEELDEHLRKTRDLCYDLIERSAKVEEIVERLIELREERGLA